MANRTVKDAHTIHGTNPQYLVEKIIRTRIYDSKYWKEQCFALTAELLVDKAMELRYIGGVYGGNVKPSPFLCLTLKMLQIQPEKDIIIEFIKQDDFKYVRALGAYYLRLVHTSMDCYKYLEPLLNDYRKLRIMNRNGQYELTHMDEFIDNLLREERINDIMLPRIQRRWHHENNNELEARISLLDDDLDDLEEESDDDDLPPSPPPTPPHRRSDKDDYSRNGLRDDRLRGRSPDRSVGRTNRDREKRHRSRSRDRGRDDPDRKRRRSRSRERRHRSPDHHHRHKHRDKDRERGRDRDHKRKDRDRERGEKGHDKDRHRERKKDKHHDREREKRKHRRERESSLDLEIAEANALRAKLGMQPLRR